jgi:uncharacterized protein
LLLEEITMSNNAKQGEFCWNELMTGDVNKAKEFYSNLFDWEVEDHKYGENMTYTMLKKGEKNVGGLMQIPEGFEQIPPHWMSYVYVDDVDQTVKKAKSLGATIKQEPMAVGDFGRLAVLKDPTGAHIAIWQSIKS